ncbi:MAG: hypothetical protein M3301_05710, partial [Chloroflexota bacterium]|nr:hypothetical protein [Chloroflexota bacterium]
VFGLRGAAGRVVGLAMHAVVSLGIGVIYAAGFQVLGLREPLFLWGLVGGAVHWLFAGLFLAVVPSMHPEIPDQLQVPGAFARNFGGADVAAFLAGHLLYGLSFGVVYALLHPAGRAAAAF